MANRHLLAVNKLEEFKNWLIENDWQIEKPQGNYEVIRARKDTERLPLIVYKKDKDGLIHLSVSDWNTKYVADFINSKKDNKSNNLQQQLDQQKAMWNELRSFLDEDKLFEYFAESSVDGYKNCLLSIKNKMQELEQGEKDE